MLVWVLCILSADLKGLGQEPAFVLGHDEHGEAGFYKASDLAFTKTDMLYVLEVGEGRIVKMDLNGRRLGSFGRKGMGPGELGNVIRIVAVGPRVWTADRETGRIQVFENDTYRSYFRPKNINAPVSMEVIGDEVFIAGRSLGEAYGAIEVYGTDGNFKRIIGETVLPNNQFGQTAALWNSYMLAKALDGALLLGFHFDSRLVVLAPQGSQVMDRDMQELYPRFEKKDRGAVFPEGFSAMAFSAGPGDTYLVSTCSVETRTCGTLLQLGKNLKTLVGSRTFASSIRQIRYAPHLGLVALITGDDEILFFETT